MRVKTWLSLTAAATVLVASPAAAQIPVGAGWQTFGFAYLNGGLGPINLPFGVPFSGTFTLNTASTIEIKVVDCCIIGDRYTLSWTGTTSGSSQTTDPGAFDGQTLLPDFNPDNAWADPRTSKGDFFFGPGSYTMTLTLSQYQAPAPGDLAAPHGWIRADVVTPEPSTMALLATGLVGMAGASIRRRRKA